MKKTISSIWIIAREYAGIAEAGGVKNVVCSLAEGLVRQNKNVTVFIPLYGCVNNESISLFSLKIKINGVSYPVSFQRMFLHGVEIIFIDSKPYLEKHAVYVYTLQESLEDKTKICGKGHSDVDIMNMLLQQAVIQYAKKTAIEPDVLHCQDAHTAILPALIRTSSRNNKAFKNTSMFVTIHNAGPGYRQVFSNLSYAVSITGLPESVLKKSMLNGNIEPFLLASDYSVLSTVSPWYAKELTDKKFDHYTEGLSGEFERRNIQIIGITNGIDYSKYNTQHTQCSHLPFEYNPFEGDLKGKYMCRKSFLQLLANFKNTSSMTCFGTLKKIPHAVYFSYHGRIAWQKGLDILEQSVELVLDSIPQARFIIIGQGDTVLETILIKLAEKYPGQLVYLRGYERSLARLAVAVSDFLVLPSVFEPCGLEDFIGQIFGTIPIAHAVGGLQKIIEGKSGFLYSTSEVLPQAELLAQLLITVSTPILISKKEGCEGIPKYVDMIKFSSALVKNSFNWDAIILKHYLPLYQTGQSCRI